MPAIHGAPDYAEMERLGLRPEEITDFSVCSNPFGPPASVLSGLASAAIERYPDSDAMELRGALAGQLGISPGNILVGNGSTELIRLAALAYFSPGDAVVVLEPDFGEYEVAVRICGGRTLTVRVRPEDDFRLPAERLAHTLEQQRPKALYLSNPHNPTGQYLTRKDVEDLLTASPDCLVVLDEAYVSFVDDAWSSLDLIGHDNLLILRSMTKDYALPGLRLGYAVASAAIIEALRKVRPPWNVNAVAQRAGILALQDKGFLVNSLQQLRTEREFLLGGLRRLGYHTVPTRANFFLVEVRDAPAFRETLLKQRILVRDCTSFGLPNYVRIAPRTRVENARLISVVEEAAGRDAR
ncbi:MAG: histidinol-phosphate aminotransferase family protein [Chloroflexi bacterium]|nr:histidinol-phosphate aminotransferase family protein [Chloroflexota bacterium]